MLIIKPFTVELNHADELIALAADKGRRLMAGQPMRFDAHMLKACELIQAGKIGQPTRFYSSGWLHAPGVATQGNSLVFQPIAKRRHHHREHRPPDRRHELDGWSVQSVFGYAGTFHTAEWPGGGLPDDQISFLMHFESGAIGVVEGGTAQPIGMPASMFEIMGTEGGITIDRTGLTIGRGVLESDGHAERFELRGSNSVDVMLRAFLESILNDQDVPVSGSEGRYAVEICWAALQSARKGQMVTLPIRAADYPSYG